MNYYKLGKLPSETVSFFYKEILKRKTSDDPYQWIQFDEHLNNEFYKIFSNIDLKIQKSSDNKKLIQKAFYSEPGHGFRIHKDGSTCKSALNIAVSCNPNDWVRWYDESYINSIATLNVVDNNKKYGSSRNINIYDYESVPFTDELKNEIGDVYVLDVDKYHSFKCNGPLPRIIIQTKFDGFPDLETIYATLKENSFRNLII